MNMNGKLGHGELTELEGPLGPIGVALDTIIAIGPEVTTLDKRGSTVVVRDLHLFSGHTLQMLDSAANAKALFEEE